MDGAREKLGFHVGTQDTSVSVTLTALQTAEDDDIALAVAAEGSYTPLYADLAVDARATHKMEKSPTKAPPAAGSPPPRTLGVFMTPQAPRTAPIAGGTGPVPRYSIGGVARRIRIEDSPWKARALVVPRSPSYVEPRAPPPTPSPARAPLSEAERLAIKERRKSALTAPDAFWAGGVPGLSPRKQALRRVAEEGVCGDSQQEEVDPRRLLQEVFVTVDVLKRRRESMLADARHNGGAAAHVDLDVRADAKAEVGRLRFPRPYTPDAVQGATNRATRTEATPAAAAFTPLQPNADGDIFTTPAPAPQMTRDRQEATPPPPVSEESDVAHPTQVAAPPPAKPTRGGRKTDVAAEPTTPRRGRTAPAAPQVPVTRPPVPAATPKARRGRAATAEPESEAAHAARSSNFGTPTKPRRGRAATVDPEGNKEPAVPARGVRKPPSATSAPVTPPARRGRATKAATPASAARGQPYAKTATDVDSAPDLLESNATADTSDAEVVLTTPKRRARSLKLKEEEDEPVLETRATGAGRAKKVPAAAATRTTRQAAIPASAPAGVEKENTQRAEQEAEAEVEGQTVVKTRVSRSRKVKGEPVEPVAAATLPKRAARTRART
ncbi:hypothetical protein GGX14DRAFT_623228 [Mycena pura]|uniref:Uncharacterized protein n=1 Tax=Mycena pura TaxID=153505 RepID=A0AAD6VJM4_9AGAR|nr:hypothetical protein GGX14DRAFT_623228 [Mycena pura]